MGNYCEFSQNLIGSIVHKHHSSAFWHHMTKIIVIVPNASAMRDHIEILKLFFNSGFLNVAICHESANGYVQYEFIYSLARDVAFYVHIPNGQMIFPDKLKNMRGFAYVIAIYNQPPRIFIGDNIMSPLIFFLEAICKIQNCNFRLLLLNHYSLLERFWVNRGMHLTLNTATIFDTPEPKLLTYETTGYCALVPIPPKISLTQFIFIKPFDGLTWMFLALSVVGCVGVFRMFRGRGAVDSPWLLGYGMFVYFIGQGVDFSRQNRMVLTILLQLIILMIFVLSNAYEGVITSFMIQPMRENRMESIDDLLASDYEILTDEAFAFHIREFQELQKLKSRMNTSGVYVSNRHEELIVQQHYVFIRNCEIAEYDLNVPLSNGRKLSDYYYLLPERFFTRFVFLEASYWNPFLERLQYYMDMCFQAGLHHFWNIMAKELNHIEIPENTTSDEVKLLKFEDLQQAFSILVIGYILATLVLIVEIFLHDCLKNLNLRYLAGRLRNRINQMAYKRKPRDPKYQRGALYYIIHRHQKMKRLRPKRLKVRQIFVQPVNRDE